METSESVGIGHPDKVADQVSDAILDAYLAEDRDARTAVEVMLKDDHVIIGGEVKSSASVDHGEVALGILNEIYPRALDGEVEGPCNWQIMDIVGRQSPDIAEGTDTGGAGDQGIVVGYACGDETTNFLPKSYYYASELMRSAGEYSMLVDGNIGTDMKTQFTFDDEGIVDTLLISVQSMYDQKELHRIVKEEILSPFIDWYGLSVNRILINPTGVFRIGGPWGDCGLTGRKTQVDAYGTLAGHGGGAFSGKDPSKVDRSGAYFARREAKRILKGYRKYGVESVEVRAAYAIGLKDPVDLSISITGDVSSDILDHIYHAGNDQQHWSPEGIDDILGLRDWPKVEGYLSTASFGHFTDKLFPWETL